MGPLELDRPLQAETLREIERSLYGKLRAHRLSEAFIQRCGEDAIQKGLIEYFRAVEDGAEIENRDAFVVRAAFCRAIDELRREARRSGGAPVEAILDSGRMAAPSTEEVAAARIEAEELHEAIEKLPAEDRQILSLHYFEQRSAESSAQALHCSERTFRRRLGKVLKTLGRELGATMPEPDSELAVEIGLIAWVSLRGARVVPSFGPPEQMVAAIDSAREGAMWLLGRARDLAARLFASGAGEKATVVASGPAGKAGSACTGALALCVLTGAIGPGVGGVDVIGGNRQPQKPKEAQPHSPPRTTAPLELEASAPAPNPSAGQADGANSGDQTGGADRDAKNRKREGRQVKGQTDGLARAAGESTTTTIPPAPPDSASSASVPSESPSAPSSAIPPDGNASTEAAQVKQQFGAFR